VKKLFFSLIYVFGIEPVFQDSKVKRNTLKFLSMFGKETGKIRKKRY
jgi:hypothetical protein